MKLFIYCKNCKNKLNLNLNHISRAQLMNSYGRFIRVNCHLCSFVSDHDVNEVRAECSIKKVYIPSAIGAGLLGLLAGPPGAIIGLVAGGLTGSAIDSKDQNAVNNFNNCYV